MRLGRHTYAIKGMDGARLIWPRRAVKSRKLTSSNEANQEKAAVLGVFLVLIIFALLLIGRFLGLRKPLPQ